MSLIICVHNDACAIYLKDPDSFKTVTEATSVDPSTIFLKNMEKRRIYFLLISIIRNFLLLYKNTLLLIFFRRVQFLQQLWQAMHRTTEFAVGISGFSLALFQMMVPYRSSSSRST